ncbi:hypothetical protein N9W79_01500 [bacterium]|nr:hypothetical protein [bacterium]
MIRVFSLPFKCSTLLFVLSFSFSLIVISDNVTASTGFEFAEKTDEKLKIVVLKPRGTMRGVEASQLLDVEFKYILSAVTDYSNHKEFMPNVDRSKIVKEEKGVQWVDQELDFGLFDVEYVLKMTKTYSSKHKTAKIEWIRASGEMKQIEGKWLLAKKGNKVAVKYESFVDPGLAIPAWIQDLLTEGAVPELFEAVFKRAKHLASTKK